jgi:hypothetical protein
MDVETVVDEEEDEVQNVKDLQMLERLYLGNANDDIDPSDTVDYDLIDSDDELMIQLIPIMKIIFNQCNTILLCSYV